MVKRSKESTPDNYGVSDQEYHPNAMFGKADLSLVFIIQTTTIPALFEMRMCEITDQMVVSFSSEKNT